MKIGKRNVTASDCLGASLYVLGIIVLAAISVGVVAGIPVAIYLRVR